ncbi:MAG: DUF4118 domain-containing protein [Anaerolinea sp.]|nr:DUF4118 domain-containing protein [Anaerolinea sp.]
MSVSVTNALQEVGFTPARSRGLVRYGTSLLIFALALAASLLLRGLVEPNPFLLFWPAVALSAWFGSFGSGLFVTFLTVFSVIYLFPSPHFDALLSVDNIARYGIFVGMSVVVSWLFEARRRAFAALQQKMTEQVRLAEALRVNGERFRLALKGSTVSVFNQDTDLRYTWLHNASGRFTLDMVRGKRDTDLVPDADEARAIERIKRGVLESGTGTRTEVTVHVDGVERCYDMTVEPLRDPDGQIVGITAVSLDVTERKETEKNEREQRMLAEALRDSATLLNSSLNLAEVLEQILSVAGRVVPHDAADIMLFEAGKARIVGERGYRTSPASDAGLLLSITDNLILQKMIETGEPLLLPNARIYPEWMGAEHIRSYVGVPIQLQDRVIGFLNLTSLQPNFFTAVHAERLKAFAPHAAVAISNAQLHEKAKAFAVLEERHRLARDLHDAISQKLFTSSLIAEAVVEIGRRDFEEALTHLETLRQLNRSALAEMRVLLLELRPEQAAKTPLDQRLEQLAETVRGRLNVETRFDLDSTCALAPEAQAALYRIAQEAINNVVKHASASHLTLQLMMTDVHVQLSIRDNGSGFDPESVSGGLGTVSMQERAASMGAQLSIVSREGQGTTVTVSWTCQQ